MRKYLSIIILLLISTCSISQTGFPKKILHGKDTLVAFLPQQIETLNRIKDFHDFYKEYGDSLAAELNKCRLAIQAADSAIASQEKELALQKEIIARRDKTILGMSIQKTNDDLVIEKTIKRKNNWRRLAIVSMAGNLIQYLFL